MLKEVCAALVEGNFNIQLVEMLRLNVLAVIDINVCDGLAKRHMVQSTVFKELVKLFDFGVKPYQPVRGRPNIILLVGLQVI